MERQGGSDLPIQSEESGRLDSRRQILTEHELAMIDEMLAAVSPHDEVELWVRKSPWGFVASVRCHELGPQSRTQVELANSEQLNDSDGKLMQDRTSPPASGED